MKRLIVLFALIITVWSYWTATTSYKETVYKSKQLQQSNVHYEPLYLEVTGEIIDYTLEKNTLILSVKSIDDKPVKQKWLLKGYEHPVVKQCIQDESYHLRLIVNKSQYQYTSPKNMTGFDYDQYLFALGITHQYKIIDYEWIEPDGFCLNCYRQGVRKWIEKALIQLPSDTSRSFLQAVLLGDKTAFDAYESFKSLGLAHVFAISGLHFGVLYVTLKKGLFISHAGIKSISIMCMMGFLLFIIGPTASAQRAFILIVYKEGCDLFERKADPFVGVSFALIIILIFQPFLILSTSLHLSFYAYFCVAIGYRSLFKKALKSKILEAIRFSLVVQVLLLPATLYYFQTANLFTFISNAFLIPLIAIILPIAFIYLGVSFMSLSLLSTFIGIFLDKLIYITLYISRWMPLKSTTYAIFRALDYTVVLYIIAVFLSFKIVWHLKLIKRKFLLIQTALIMIIIVVGSIPETAISFIDVGHGDLAILSSGNIHGIIDTGDGRLNVAGLLRSKGIYQLAFVVLSHAHQDHIGDLEALSSEMSIKSYYMNRATAIKILESIPDLAPYIIVVDSNYRIEIGDDFVLTLMPLIGARAHHDPNEDALIAKVDVNSQTGYFLGDVSKAMLDGHPFDQNVTFIKSAHHGSATSLSTKLYGTRAIDYVITSCHTRYKLPHKDFNALLNNHHIPHFTTYNYGEVKLTFGKNKVKLETYLTP